MFDFLKRDKRLHIGISALLAIFVLTITGSMLIATVVTIIIGLFKEYIWDLFLEKGKFDYMDILANLAGISLVILLYILFGKVL